MAGISGPCCEIERANPWRRRSFYIGEYRVPLPKKLPGKLFSCRCFHATYVSNIQESSFKYGLILSILSWCLLARCHPLKVDVASTPFARFAQIVHAVKYIHGMRVVHRRVNARNIFVTDSGDVKLGISAVEVRACDAHAQTHMHMHMHTHKHTHTAYGSTRAIIIHTMVPLVLIHLPLLRAGSG